jgi:hypothetical protein
VTTYPYVWAWRNRTITQPYPIDQPAQVPWFGDGVDRTGQPCRVIARGTMNSAWVAFPDGFQVVTSRGGLRRASTGAEDS